MEKEYVDTGLLSERSENFEAHVIPNLNSAAFVSLI